MKKAKQQKPHQKDANTRGFLTPLLTKGQYKKELAHRTRLEFNPLERSIQGDLAGSQSRQAEIPGWFQQYKDAVSGAATKTAAAYQQANQNFSQQAQQAGQQDTASRQDMQNRASQDAALRGVPVDYNGAQAALEAANARNNLQSQFAGTISTLGANQQGYLADKGRIGTGEMINQILKEQGRERGIRNDMRALAQKKGDFAYQLASDLRESDRKYQLSKKTLKGEMSRAQLSANTSTANSKRSSATSRANNQNTQANENARNRADNRAKAKQNAKDRRNQSNRDKYQQQQENKRNRQDNKAKKGKGKK